MTAKLQFRRGLEEREIACAPLLTIGRSPPNEIVIPHPKISRNHAMIRMLGQGEYYLIDDGSTNGTFLNGKRVVMPTLLKDLDVIVLEDCTLTFRAAHGGAAAEPEEDAPATVTMTSMGIELEDVTMLVCDIRNYTPISESMPPNELAALMAKWFKMATKVIAECHGTIDKFIGDAILVRWVSGIGKPTARGAGANDTNIEHRTSNAEGIGKSGHPPVVEALRAARKLDEVCALVNATFKHLPYPFKIGVGINTGQAVLGSIGGSGYREYTVIGDSVNMAFRFETESKRLGKDIVIGPDSYKRLPERLWDCALQTVTVKGKSEPISVWAISFSEVEALLAKAAE